MRALSRHRIHVQHGQNVTAVRERIERVLGVTTTARPEGGPWGVYFLAPADVDLDFLRPDVLPPTGAPKRSPSPGGAA